MYWVDETGGHPAPATIITADEVRAGRWRVNPGVAYSIARGNYVALQNQAADYVEKLAAGGKYPLMVWPFHAMIGGIGHALVSCVEEAGFFHSVCRSVQMGIEVKGGNPLTENYSIFSPEVLTGPGNTPLPGVQANNTHFLDMLLEHDYVIIGGQAKSHCVAWSIRHMLDHILQKDRRLVEKVYLPEDLTSPVVIPGVIDFTQQANDTFAEFQNAGMHVVQSTTPIADWPGIRI
jgi:nicotinamidase-related amidase